MPGIQFPVPLEDTIEKRDGILRDLSQVPFYFTEPVIDLLDFLSVLVDIIKRRSA